VGIYFYPKEAIHQRRHWIITTISLDDNYHLVVIISLTISLDDNNVSITRHKKLKKLDNVKIGNLITTIWSLSSSEM